MEADVQVDYRSGEERTPGFRLGIYVFKDAEIVDFAALPNYSFSDAPALDAFLIPGGFGTRQEMRNRRLHEFVRSLPETTLLTSVCTVSWVYGKMGLLDGLSAT